MFAMLLIRINLPTFLQAEGVNAKPYFWSLPAAFQFQLIQVVDMAVFPVVGTPVFVLHAGQESEDHGLFAFGLSRLAEEGVVDFVDALDFC